MKWCKECKKFYDESQNVCISCGLALKEMSLENVLASARTKSLAERIGIDKNKAPEAYQQHYIRSYLGNQSSFLVFDLCKSMIKRKAEIHRFFIQPINFVAFLNVPWLVFNIIDSNLFHLQYTGFCQRCRCRIIPGAHSNEECEYNTEYFHILEDVLSGDIGKTKEIYEQRSAEKVKCKKKSAYRDLFLRQVHWESMLDVCSIGLSVLFWLYLAIFISWPMFKVLMQKLEFIEEYEWGLSSY